MNVSTFSDLEQRAMNGFEETWNNVAKQQMPAFIN